MSIVTEFKVLSNFEAGQGGFDLFWKYDLSKLPPPPFMPTFRVEAGPTDQGPWSLVAETQRDFMQGVTGKLHTNAEVRFFRLLVFRGLQLLETTTAFSRTNNLNRHDYLIYREILRREHLQMRKYIGDRVLIYRFNREYKANDKEFDEIIGSSIASTEKPELHYSWGRPESGFFYPIETWVSFGDTVTHAENAPKASAGPNEEKVQQARFLAYPELKQYDIVHILASRKKYEVEGVKVQLGLPNENTPIAQVAQISLLPMDDPRHRLKLPPGYE
jgi:hypothetical protein